jgi:hypothetical protein
LLRPLIYFAEKLGKAKKYLSLRKGDPAKKPRKQKQFKIVSLCDYKTAATAGKLAELKLASKVVKDIQNEVMKSEEENDG